MKYLLLIISVLYSSLSYAELGPVPIVPTNIEIAGIKLKLTNDAREEIQKDVNALRASDKYFQIKLDRVNLYFPIIERVLQEEGVPDDIKYLSIQESALIADAESTSKALGYWQFKDFTAREVGLRVDNKIDERMNVVSATRGAARYFKRNHLYFKNWIYCVSAYQAGPSGAKKYVDESQIGTDKLTITSKTHWYVLRYIAHVIAFREEVGLPHSEGIFLAEENQGAGKTLHEIAEKYNVDNELVNGYNKWLLHGRIPEDKTYTVIIPVKGKPKSNPQIVSKPAPNKIIKSTKPMWFPSQQAKGYSKTDKAIFLKINGLDAVMASENDDINTLADKCALSTDQLIRFNDMNSNTEIESGEIYYIRPKKNHSSIRFHVAQYDETMWEIAQKYGIKLKSLERKNRMEPGEEVRPGRLMWLFKRRPSKTSIEYHTVKKPKPAEKKTPVADPKKESIIVIEKPTYIPPKTSIETEESKTNQIQQTLSSTTDNKKDVSPIDTSTQMLDHMIQAGETLWSLSKKYGVSVDDIIEWNGLTSGDLIPNQPLKIMRDFENKVVPQIDSISQKVQSTFNIVTNTKPVASQTALQHTVQNGESLWGISRKYNIQVTDLQRWNNLSPNEPINPGQKLLIAEPSAINNEKTKPSETQEKSPEYTKYTVRGGDSLYKISREFDMSVEELMYLNALSSTSLSVGQELRVKKK